MRSCFFLTVLFSLMCFASAAQSHKKSIKKFQNELNRSYSNPDKSPLPPDQINSFEGLPFFEIDENFQVIAKFEKLPPASLFTMKTSDNRLRDFERYALATFSLAGKEYQLTLYKSTSKVITPGYENSLFVPFTDSTSAKETYGGGRYMDVEIPDGETIVLDFNKAYNPYCAYSDRYSCPIPPKENQLSVAIMAGVRYIASVL